MKTRKRMKGAKKDWIFDFTVYFICILLLLITLYPIYFVLIASVSEPNAVNLGHVDFYPIGFNLKAYENLLHYEDLWMGYRNTIFYVLLGTFLALAINLPAGYALSRTDMYGYKFIKVLTKAEKQCSEK